MFSAIHIIYCNPASCQLIFANFPKIFHGFRDNGNDYDIDNPVIQVLRYPIRVVTAVGGSIALGGQGIVRDIGQKLLSPANRPFSPSSTHFRTHQHTGK